MKKVLLIVAVIFSITLFSQTTYAQVDKIVGTWKTIDDETGEAKSHVKIFKATNGYYYGRITKLIGKGDVVACDNCEGDLKGENVVGMLIITKMEVDGDMLDDGKIMDPNNGEYYYCSLELSDDDSDILEVRGSIDSWGLAGRTQTWHRLK